MKAIWLIIISAMLTGKTEAALTTNLWITGSGKWEDSTQWNQGVPSSDDAVNNITVGLAGTTTIDTATVTQHVINSCMTISNLVVGGPVSRVLSLANANNTPGNIGLTILNTFTITGTGSLSITNSDLRVTSPTGGLFDDATALLNFGTVTVTNLSVGRTGVGTLTVSNGTLIGRTVKVADLGGSQGTMTIAGGINTFRNLSVGSGGATGTVWLTGGQLTVSNESTAVGDPGIGQMTVSNGTWAASIVAVRQGTLNIAGGTSKLWSLSIASGASTLTAAVWIVGGDLAITNTTTAFPGLTNGTVVGLNGFGQMTVSNGTFLTRDLYVGTNTNSHGTFTVAGGTNTVMSLLSVNGLLGATGTVWMTGGQLTVTGGVTQVGVTGAGQMTVSNGTWLANSVFVGKGAGSQGTLTIAGGTNYVGSDLVVGSAAYSTGTVWMTGGQIEVTTGVDPLVVVADSGVGRMTVSNGTWLSKYVFVGSTGGGSGTLTIAGGTNDIGILNTAMSLGGTGVVWLTGGQLLTTNFGASIGFAGSGRLTVSNGNWQARNVVAGLVAGSKGTITAAGGISTINSNLVLGDCASDAFGLLIVNGGHMFATNAAHDATLDVRNGWVLLTAGQFIVDKLVITNACGYFFHGGGSLSVGSLLLDPNMDADADGLPNGWELAHGLDPLESIGADGYFGDPDGDGFNNYAEYLAGTDPMDPNSTPFHITSIARQGNNMLISWTTAGGKTNRVQATAGRSGSYSNNFTDLSPVIFVPGASLGTTNYLDVGGATNRPARFYRVRLVP